VGVFCGGLKPEDYFCLICAVVSVGVAKPDYCVASGDHHVTILHDLKAHRCPAAFVKKALPIEFAIPVGVIEEIDSIVLWALIVIRREMGMRFYNQQTPLGIEAARNRRN
jgi:hypothetical protein